MFSLRQKKVFGTMALLLAGFSLLTAAELKIATVNLEKLFREYYKTAIIEQDLAEQGKVYRNYIARQAEMLGKDEAEYRRQRDSSMNVALTAAEREKRSNAADVLEKSLRSRRAELEQYAADRAKALQEMAVKERAKVVEEIKNEIRRRAAIEGYAMVLDISGASMNETAIVIYSIEKLDITGKVLTELNRGAKTSAAKAKSDTTQATPTAPTDK
ncbi:MAG: OmpH family outer membrane protein [Lentisphaerae bacterium]|nr:OmpH family outer membrane protein [Lentisphaerota bacterium]